jgi:hypothetical protein
VGLGADLDHGQEGIGAGADNGEVAGRFVDDEEHGGGSAGFGGIEAHGGRRSADVDGASNNATIEDVDDHDATSFAIGDVHFGEIFFEDGGGGSGAEHHVVGKLVGPGVDDLQAMGFGRDDVEFAAVGLEEHLRGLAGEFEVGEEDAAGNVDDGEVVVGAAHDKGDGGVGKCEDFVGLRDDVDGGAKLQSGGVVDGESGGAAIDDEDGLVVLGDAGLHGLRAGSGAADDGAGGAVDGEKLVGAGGSGEGAVVGGREIEGERSRADGDSGGDLGGAGVENPDIAGGAADAPDFGPFGALAHVSDAGADVDLLRGLERDEVDDGDGAVGGGDIGIDAQARAKEGGAMFAKEDDDERNEQDGEEEVEAEAFEVGHWMRRFYMRGERRGNLWSGREIG